MKEKQYEVEIYEKHSHGHYGKTHYFGWVLSSDKRENAETFALEILAGMTPDEIKKESDGRFITSCGLHRWEALGNGKVRYIPIPNDQPVGYEFAESAFTVKARVFRG